MLVRPIERKDNLQVKTLIQTTLESVGFDIPGTAYFDPEINDLYSFYHSHSHSNYWVIEENKSIIGGVGIAPFTSTICELQKLYVQKSYQGQGLSKQLMDVSLDFAQKHYQSCYLETHSDLVSAYKLYESYDFELLKSPFEGSVHSAMDRWYLKTF